MAEVFLAKKRGAEDTFKLLVLKRVLPAYGHSRRFRTMFAEEAQLATRLNLLATRAFLALDCRDYARVDLRLSRSGAPMILEVNANPDMSPTACFAGAVTTAGLDRSELIVGLVRRALARGGTLSTQRCG